MPMEGDDRLRELFDSANTIAVIGIKDAENEDAFRVPRYMQGAGFRILPVNPKVDHVLGEDCVPIISQLPANLAANLATDLAANLAADLAANGEENGDAQGAGQEIDIVDIFRAPENVPAHIDEILGLNRLPRVVWMQLGIQHGPSAQRLREAGIEVIQDRCIMIEHRRLVGSAG